MHTAPKLLALLSVLLIAACSNVEKEIEQHKASPPKVMPAASTLQIEEASIQEIKKDNAPATGLFQTSLGVALVSNQIECRFSLRNTSDQNLELSFGSGQMYDLFVFDEQGDLIYSWSHDKAFITVIVDRVINIDEELQFTEVWDLRDNDGNLVPQGRYLIAVKFMAALKEQEKRSWINPDNLTDSTEIIYTKS